MPACSEAGAGGRLMGAEGTGLSKQSITDDRVLGVEYFDEWDTLHACRIT